MVMLAIILHSNQLVISKCIQYAYWVIFPTGEVIKFMFIIIVANIENPPLLGNQRPRGTGSKMRKINGSREHGLKG